MNIYVSNLAYNATDDDLRQLFESYGEVDTSVHEMSSESKWRETTVSGGKGPSMYGRNLGTSA